MSVLCISEPVSPRTPSAPRISLGIASPAAAAGRLLPAIVICLTDTVGFDLLLPWKKRKTHLSFYFVLSIIYRRSSTFWRWGVWAGCPPPASHPLSKRLGGTWEGGRAQAGAARTPPPVPPAAWGFAQPGTHPGSLPSCCLPGRAYLGWTCFRGTAEIDAAH